MDSDAVSNKEENTVPNSANSLLASVQLEHIDVTEEKIKQWEVKT